MSAPLETIARNDRADWPSQAVLRLADYATLSKARLATLVLAATSAGYLFAARGEINLVLLAHTLIGTALVAFGASALNQVLERERDGRMARTADRPIPAGRISVEEGLCFGATAGIGGTLYLLFFTTPAAAALAAATLLLYVLVYTPLKPRTPLCLPIGAVPGAMPPLIGYAAATGGLSYEAWLPALIVYFWQHPHFLAISWLYREDYARGGFAIEAVADPEGRATGRQATGKSILLALVALLPAATRSAGSAYAVAALGLSVAFLALSAMMAAHCTRGSARRVFIASIIYLPLLLLLLVVDRTGG